MTIIVTRAAVGAALTALGRPDIADGVYARRIDGDRPAQRGALALDYDEPTDLALLVLALDMIPGVRAGDLADCRAGKGAHPADPGPDAIWWPSIRLDEPTVEQWADERNDCAACCGDDDHDPDCATHERAPWDRPLADRIAATAHALGAVR